MAQAKFAEMSVAVKQKNRYLDALDYYKELIKRYPHTEFRREADIMAERVNKALAKIQS